MKPLIDKRLERFAKMHHWWYERDWAELYSVMDHQLSEVESAEQRERRWWSNRLAIWNAEVATANEPLRTA